MILNKSVFKYLVEKKLRTDSILFKLQKHLMRIICIHTLDDHSALEFYLVRFSLAYVAGLCNLHRQYEACMIIEKYCI